MPLQSAPRAHKLRALSSDSVVTTTQSSACCSLPARQDWHSSLKVSIPCRLGLWHSLQDMPSLLLNRFFFSWALCWESFCSLFSLFGFMGFGWQGGYAMHVSCQGTAFRSQFSLTCESKAENSGCEPGSKHLEPLGHLTALFGFFKTKLPSY